MFWVLIWHILSRLINKEILLASPLSVAKKLLYNMQHKFFWTTILFSLSRISLGFSLGAVLGSLLALFGSRWPLVKDLLEPLLSTIKSTPVASFIILLLIWMPSKNLSVAISFLMVLPILYTSVLAGIENTDQKLIEMAQVFRLSKVKTIRFIYLPEIYPYFHSAASVALGLAWKSGIAAEVIGNPRGSIGAGLYEAKIYLVTDELFAWTLVTILLSVLLEKIVLKILDRVMNRLRQVARERGKENIEEATKRATRKVSRKMTKDIIIDEVTIKYGDTIVIEKMHALIPTGSRIALIGKSGRGKTSLIKALMGLIPYEGHIHNLEGIKIAPVFQEDRLIQDMTLYGNIAICTSADRATIEAHMAELSLKEDQHKKANELSGGMRRRAAMIRAVLAESDLLILDEPFKGLDEKMKQTSMDYIKKHQNGRTLLLVTHEKEELDYMACQPTIRLEEELEKRK